MLRGEREGEREGDREVEWREPQRREKMTKREKDMGKRKRQKERELGERCPFLWST